MPIFSATLRSCLSTLVDVRECLASLLGNPLSRADTYEQIKTREIGDLLDLFSTDNNLWILDSSGLLFYY
jgi:hypothetical protein